MPQRTNGLSGAEALAAAALTLFAVPIATAFLLDEIGLSFPALPVMLVTAIASVLSLAWISRSAAWRRADVWELGAVVAIVFGALMWFAHGGRFPPGRGSDLTHHLMLIDYVGAHWQLPRGAGIETALGMMAVYPPGVHVLSAIAGTLAGTDGPHAVYAIVAASVAIKAGLVFLIALRLMPAGVAAGPLALSSVALLFIPRAYSVGAFTQFSFFAQVMAELFAVGMWWALVAWDEQPSMAAMGIFALAGAAAFLTWPIVNGPLMLAIVPVVLFRSGIAWKARIAHLAAGLLPIALIAGAYLYRHAGWLGYAGVSGGVIRPTAALYGWGFLALVGIGSVILVARRQGRVTLVFGAALLLQMTVLWRYALTHGADNPYLALKLLYLGVCVQAVVAAVGLATIVRRAGFVGPAATAIAWILAATLSFTAARSLLSVPRQNSLMTEPLYRASLWARDHVAPDCVEYLVGDDGTAYWIHLAILRNKWMSPRTGAEATYQPKLGIMRWLAPEGMPYAIADLTTLPRDVARELDIVADFGAAAVARRRGPSSCDPGEPAR